MSTTSRSRELASSSLDEFHTASTTSCLPSTAAKGLQGWLVVPLLDRELPWSQCLNSGRCGLAASLAFRRDLMRLSRHGTAAVRPHGGRAVRSLAPGPGQFKAIAAGVLGHERHQLRDAPLLERALGMDEATRGAVQILDGRDPVRLPLLVWNTLRPNRANAGTFRILNLTAQRADKRGHRSIVDVACDPRLGQMSKWWVPWPAACWHAAGDRQRRVEH